jgi:hypothetical protein
MGEREHAERPVHLIIIDSWVARTVERELAAGSLPALAHLVRHGRMDLQCTTIFPSVTPACLTAIATGMGPHANHITGVLWYNRPPDRYVHYWPYPQSLLWGTIEHVVGDFFIGLNGEHLARGVKTVFELLEEADVASACVNFPVSRGPYLHQAEIPGFIRRLGKLPPDLALPGPRHMRHGDMIRGGMPRSKGFWKKYGFNDHQSALHSADLVRKARPAFMLTYFNENDLRTHHHGPDNIGFSLAKVDAELGRMMDAYGSWDAAVAEARWILVGDHAQSNTFPLRPGHAVNVFKMFPKHRIAPLRTGGLRADACDFAVGPNDRMCYFYFPEDRAACREEVLDVVSRWPAVDQVFWRDGETFHGYRRVTGETMSWKQGGPVSDPHGQRWTVAGSPGVVGAWLDGDFLRYRDYPNALERVTSALSVPGGGTMVLTAALGYEFTSGFPMGRGNHGSLHALDSYVPLVTVGVQAPLRPRITDLVGMVLDTFGVARPGYMAPAPAPEIARPERRSTGPG